MTEDIKAALAVLEQAMDIEQEGNRFYLKASQTTQDKKGQEMFTTLADDEQKHFDMIKRQHTALTSEGRWAGSPEIKPVDIDLGKPLFPRGIEELENDVSTRSGINKGRM